MTNNTRPLEIYDVIRAFTGSFSLITKILHDYYDVHSFGALPAPSSPLYLEDHLGVPKKVHLSSVGIIGPTGLIHKSWDSKKQEFLKQFHESTMNGVVLVDVGSNIGLFSRQCLSQVKNIQFLYCYEPEPYNFELLKRNLGEVDNVFLLNQGLSSESGRLEFYMDGTNSGNYSLNSQAMGAHFSKTLVDVVDAASQEAAWLSHGLPIFYKSDTQGFDERIATSLSMEFWSNVKAGIFELWRIPGKSYDKEKFLQILDSFPYKVFEKHPGKNISSQDVLKYLDASDAQYDDLLFWR